MTHKLPELSYGYDALEPFIDEQTMTIHHSKHHQAYVNNLNAALEKHPELASLTAEELITNLDGVPEDIRTAVRNHGGGHVNHSFFWSILKKGVQIKGEIFDAINTEFGSFESFQEQFSKAAAGQFGSGWGWLVMDHGKLSVMSTANQDSPLSSGKTPLVTIDIWEHAYYLKYQNRRPDYIKAFFSVVDWEKVNNLYLQAKKTATVA